MHYHTYAWSSLVAALQVPELIKFCLCVLMYFIFQWYGTLYFTESIHQMDDIQGCPDLVSFNALTLMLSATQ